MNINGDTWRGPRPRTVLNIVEKHLDINGQIGSTKYITMINRLELVQDKIYYNLKKGANNQVAVNNFFFELSFLLASWLTESCLIEYPEKSAAIVSDLLLGADFIFREDEVAQKFEDEPPQKNGRAEFARFLRDLQSEINDITFTDVIHALSGQLRGCVTCANSTPVAGLH